MKKASELKKNEAARATPSTDPDKKRL